jgi:DNA-binding NtrC family response regulator
VTKVLRTTADVVSVDSLKSARLALAAGTVDLAVLDVSLGTESGLDLLPSLRNCLGEAIPVIIFSANVACLACDGQIRATLAKSDNSLEVLAETVRRRLGLASVGAAEEVA